jgi:hypothetical protein
MLTAFALALCGQYQGVVACVVPKQAVHAAPYHATSSVAAYHAPSNQTPYFAVDPQYFATAVAAYIREQAAAQVRAQADRDVARRLDRIEAGLQPKPAAEAAPEPTLPSPPPESYPAGIANTNTNVNVNANANAPVTLASILSRNNCVKCHAGEGASGGFPIFEASGKPISLGLDSLAAIYEAVAEGRMPPKAKASEAERAFARQKVEALKAALKE